MLSCAALALAVAACGDGSSGADPRTEAGGAAGRQDAASRPAIVVLGDSLTAGYGLAEEEAYPALLQERLDEAGLEFEVVNAGVSGDTSAGGLRRIDWVLKRGSVAVLIVALGGNDGLRGVSPDVLEANLQGIVDEARAREPGLRVIVAGMQAPPNMGRDYTERFRDVFAEVAERNGAELVPFLLDGVAADRALNQVDGIHPTAAGQRILADNVWAVLEPIARAVDSP